MKKRYPQVSKVPIQLALEYVSMGPDEPDRRIYRNFPVEPNWLEELVVAIRPFDPDIEERLYNAEKHGKPQIILSGTARALEEFGRYLIALARLETTNSRPNAHFDDVRNDDGGTVHVVVQRRFNPF